MEYSSRFNDIDALSDAFVEFQRKESHAQNQLFERWKKSMEITKEKKLKVHCLHNALTDITTGDLGKDEKQSYDADDFDTRLKLSFAGSNYEVKRSLFVRDTPIGWNLLSCLLKKRWEKFLLYDRHGRIYFDYESGWIKPIVQAVKGDENILLGDSPANEPAWEAIIKKFQLGNKITVKTDSDQDDLRSSVLLQEYTRLTGQKYHFSEFKRLDSYFTYRSLDGQLDEALWKNNCRDCNKIILIGTADGGIHYFITDSPFVNRDHFLSPVNIL